MKKKTADRRGSSVEEEQIISNTDDRPQTVRHRRQQEVNQSQDNNHQTMNAESDDDHDDDGGVDDVDDDDVDNSRLPQSNVSSHNLSALPIHETNVPRVACAILASLTTGGTTYAFGLYGDALKKSLHLTQSQLDTISAVFFLAGLASFIPGGFADRYGTRLGISIGGVTGAASLLSFWVVSKGMIPFISNVPNFAVFVLSALNVGIFLSCALVTGSVFKIISCQCGPGSKGGAVGAAKGYVGLGSGTYACLFESIRQPNMSELDFLPMCAFFFIVAATIPSWFVLPDKANETIVPDVLTPLHFRFLYASLAMMAALIIFNALNELNEESEKSQKKRTAAEPNYWMAGLVLLVWWGPILAQFYLPQKSDYVTVSSIEAVVDGEVQGEDTRAEQEMLLHSTDSSNSLDANGSDAEERSQPPQKSFVQSPRNGEAAVSGAGDITMEPIPSSEVNSRSDDEFSDEEEDDEEIGQGTRRGDSAVRRDKNLFEMLKSPSALMMLWTTTILAGGGTVETNNLGQMVESLGFPKIVTPATLALFSVAQSGGRVITGAASEASLNYDTRRCCIDRGVPRPFFFVLASVAAMIAHAILAVATDELFFVIGVTLSGVAFGMIWPLMVLCVGEIFGTAHVGANYMFYDGFTSAAGTLILSKIVAQRVYEDHIDSDGSGKGDNVTCYGQQCFQQTHVAIIILSLTCVVTSVLMQYKTRDVYNKNSLHAVRGSH